MSPTKSAFDSPLKQRPRRPSFASPTKSSLARNYPGLLPGPRPERPSSSGLDKSNTNERADLLARGKEARAFVMGEKDAQSIARPKPATNGEKTQASASALQPRVIKPQETTPRARRTARPSMLDNVSEEEAELPMTPSQRTVEEQDTPRRGALYSSPSKRPPRLRDSVKPSPLKEKAPSVQQDRSEIPLDELVENRAPIRKSEKVERPPPDPELEERKREKKRLARELKDLKDQVSRCTEEIVKIQEQSSAQSLQPEAKEDLIAFINKIARPDVKEDEEQTSVVSNLLCSFLPFSARLIPLPKSKQAQQKPVASHRPLDLDDPLPYLEMFTDFKISTQPSLPRGRVFADSNRVHQKHVIDIIGPQSLLTTTISIIIDTLTNKVVDLTVLRLPSWAERELGIFVRTRAQERDLGNACWAIGSFWTIANKRAEFWHRCETSFAHLIPGKTSKDTENQMQAGAGKTIARKVMVRHLGRDILTLENQHVILKIRWTITFDWTGEAESEVRVEPSVPQVCKFYASTQKR
jgi:hypothetical protein